MAKDDKKLKRSKSAEEGSPTNKINNKRKKGRGDKAGPSIKKNKSYPIVDDVRFQSVHYDPIFQNIPKKESKVEVDSRFDRMFADESFGNRSRVKIDKRGKIKEKTESHLTRYYVEEKEKKKKEKNKGVIEEEKKFDHEERENEEEEESKSMEEEEIESEEGGESTEFEESSSSDDDDEYDDFEDDDEDTMNNDITQYLLANQGNVTTTSEETNRLAIVNLDWDNMKAADLYVALSSCLPSGGQLLSVSIYPTELGLKCMEIEAAKGPSVLLNGNEGNDSDESESEDESKQNEKLRSYELNKLSYYHGVAVFDSSTTANHVYEFLDGTEFLSTANVFDLRFVPDSMEFKHPPRDVATEDPASYSAPDFETRALQHSDVKLTWEVDDPKRTKTLRRKFKPDELDDLNEYLASSEDDSEDEGSEDENEGSEDGNGKTSKKHRDAEKYRELLMSGNKSNSDEDEVGDMEVTFKPELEEINKRILEKKDKKSKTVWEQVCEKNIEKKKARRNRSKNASSDDDSTDDDVNTKGRENMEHDDFFMEDETIKSNKSNGKVKEGSSDSEEKEREATIAELELLVADDNNDNVKGYKLKRNNKKAKKGKKGEMEEVESKLPDIDTSKDPRFSALISSHLYALDPTDPQYKRTSVYARQQLDKKKKNKNPQPSTNEKEPLNVETRILDDDDDAEPIIDREKYELSSAIKSIKKNLKNLNKSTKSK